EPAGWHQSQRRSRTSSLMPLLANLHLQLVALRAEALERPAVVEDQDNLLVLLLCRELEHLRAGSAGLVPFLECGFLELQGTVLRTKHPPAEASRRGGLQLDREGLTLLDSHFFLDDFDLHFLRLLALEISQLDGPFHVGSENASQQASGEITHD